jgi:hypothetical protein
MSLHEKITQMVDEELEERVNAILNEYALTISKKHAIPLELLLKDIPGSFVSTTCKGTKSDGRRCTFKAIHSGYCGKHKSQGERVCHRVLSSSSLHNHGPEQMFVRGCPGCASSKELIDLGV